MISLKDAAGLVKSYALVDAEDYQQVTVNNNIQTLIAQFTDRDTSSLSSATVSHKKAKMVSGQVEQLASQIISGTTVYYLASDGNVYKVKASSETTDLLPFLKVGDHFEAELIDDHFLKGFTIVEPNDQQ